MKDIVKPALVLVAVAVAVALALAFTYQVTKPLVDLRAAAELEAAKKEVLPSADAFAKIDKGSLADDRVSEVFAGTTGGQVAGWVFSVSAKGYAGPVKATVGLDAGGKITGVKIAGHTETPGLGTKIFEPKFLAQYLGKTPATALTVTKTGSTRPEEIDAVSGATITSRALTRAVSAAVEYVLNLKKAGQP